MGKLKDKLIEIMECLEKGYRPKTIAAMLSVPVEWVYDVQKSMSEESITED